MVIGAWEELSYSRPRDHYENQFPKKISKVSSLWVSGKSVQWSFRVGSVGLHRGSWTKKMRGAWIMFSS